jgi:hypothetical protein
MTHTPDDEALTLEERRDRAITIAQSAIGAVERLNSEIRKLRSRNRVLAISLVLDILLTFGLSFNALQTAHVSDQANKASHQAEVASYQTCVASNKARADQLRLWGFVLTLIPTTTPHDEQIATGLSQQIHTIFAPRDCGKAPQ